MQRPSTRTLSWILLSTLALTLSALAAGQQAAEPREWEYLVVSYGQTSFIDPLMELEAMGTTFSKLEMFGEIGITLPLEAIDLQRNIDVLGKFGWELVAVVGAVGGDQQLVFKRPYDAERSAQEAERIHAERSRLLEAYNAQRAGAGEGSELIELDAFERAQAIEAKNEADAAAARSLISPLTGTYAILTIDAWGVANSPASQPRVMVNITLDVSAEALVGPNQYRRSLADRATEDFMRALLDNGFQASPSQSCPLPSAPGLVTVHVSAVVQHEGSTTTVHTRTLSFCYDPS